MADKISPELLAKMRFAVKQARNQIRWKSDKDAIHLAKRIALGHLPPTATLTDYEKIINAVLNSNRSKVYLFYYQSKSPYPTLTTKIENSDWVVIINLDGIMETAFPPEDLAGYLSDPAYRYVSSLEELL